MDHLESKFKQEVAIPGRIFRQKFPGLIFRQNQQCEERRES